MLRHKMVQSEAVCIYKKTKNILWQYRDNWRIGAGTNSIDLSSPLGLHLVIEVKV